MFKHCKKFLLLRYFLRLYQHVRISILIANLGIFIYSMIYSFLSRRSTEQDLKWNFLELLVSSCRHRKWHGLLETSTSNFHQFVCLNLSLPCKHLYIQPGEKLFQIENDLVLTLKQHYMKMHGIIKAKFFSFFVIYGGDWLV